SRPSATPVADVNLGSIRRDGGGVWVNSDRNFSNLPRRCIDDRQRVMQVESDIKRRTVGAYAQAAGRGTWYPHRAVGVEGSPLISSEELDLVIVAAADVQRAAVRAESDADEAVAHADGLENGSRSEVDQMNSSSGEVAGGGHGNHGPLRAERHPQWTIVGFNLQPGGRQRLSSGNHEAAVRLWTHAARLRRDKCGAGERAHRRNRH